ncbi:hypothetical protein GC163_03685 [bacterium]|nr:hypothetical protein [bacterium]
MHQMIRLMVVGLGILVGVVPSLWADLPAEQPWGVEAELPAGLAQRLFRVADDVDNDFLLRAPDGTAWQGRVDRTRVDSVTKFVSFGHFVDRPHSEFLAIVDNGRIAMILVPNLEERYLLIPAGDTAGYRLIKSTAADVSTNRHVLSENAAAPPQQRRRDKFGIRPAAMISFPPQIIDVLFLYTPRLRMQTGGGTAEGVQAIADLAIEYANEAYLQSGVSITLRKIYAVEVSYQESGDAAVDLERLTRPADGWMDEAFALRLAYRADLVHLFLNSSNLSDLGWLNNMSTFNANWTFSVSTAVTVPQDTFTRAIGSNQGLDHDYVTPSMAVFPYSFGYAFRGVSGQNHSTIMSNSNVRIRRHSNPNLLYDGVPMGRLETGSSPANAALSLNQTAATIAAIADNDVIPPPVISSEITASGVVGQEFQYQITAANGPTSFGAAGLPSALTCNSVTGLISGIPRTVGVYRIDLSASNRGGTGVKVLTLTIDGVQDCPIKRLARRLPQIPLPKLLQLKPEQTAWLDDCREFRDEVLKSTSAGQRVIEHYYHFGPAWLARLQQHPEAFQNAVSFLDGCIDRWSHRNREVPFQFSRDDCRQLQEFLTLLSADAPLEEQAAWQDLRHWLAAADVVVQSDGR